MEEFKEKAKTSYNISINIIRDRMKELGVNSSDLSRNTGISRQVIGRYFKKTAVISFEKHLIICASLEINLFWIYKEMESGKIKELGNNKIN